MRIERFAGQPAALPAGVVGVLDRQLGQRRRPAGGEGRIERRQLAQADSHRPAIGDDVMQREHQQVVRLPTERRSGRGQSQQRRTHQRSGGEVERPAGQPGADGAGLGLGSRLAERRQVDQREPQLEAGGDHRRRLAASHGVGGAQHVVTARDLVQAAREHPRIEPAA